MEDEDKLALGVLPCDSLGSRVLVLPGLDAAASVPLAWPVAEPPSAHAGSAWHSVPPPCMFLAGEKERDFLSQVQQA